MVMTRSVASRRPATKIESELGPHPASEPGPAPVQFEITPAASVRCNEDSVRAKSRSARSTRSKKSVMRAEALERLAKAKLEETRAATALAEAEVAKIEAELAASSDQESEVSADHDKSALVQSWLDSQQKRRIPINDNVGPPEPEQPAAVAYATAAPQSPSQMIDISALATALTEAARATTSHAPLKYFYELPSFSGSSSEWLAFKAAYRDTHRRFTKVENLLRLRRCLRGVAKEAAISLFVAESEPEEVMRLLEVRFGRPDALVMAEIEKVKALPKLTDSPRDLCIFASRINNIVAVVRALKRNYYLHNPEAVRSVVDKMTATIKFRWYDYAAERSEDEPDLIKLSSFLARQAELCSRYAQAETSRDSTPPPQKKQQRAYATTPVESAERTPSESAKSMPAESVKRKPTRKPTSTTECPVCKNEHTIQKCSHFKELCINDRWEKAKEVNACFRCLNRRTFSHRCSYKPCGINECKGSHHSLLHSEKETSGKTEPSTDPAVVTSARPKTSGQAFLKVIPVKVCGPKASVETFALLDEGSTITLIEDNTAQFIGATGPKEPLHIEGVAGARVSAGSSMRVSLKIKGRNADTEHKFTARTIEQLRLAPQTIDEATLNECTHLHEVSQDLIYHRGAPTILIGQDNWNLIVSRSVRSGARGQPVASLTELGWVMHGPSGHKAHQVHLVSKINTVHNNDEEERMEEMMKKFFDLDAIGIEPKRPKNDPNDRALALLETRSRRLSDGRFETGLLWRHDDVVLPDNRDAAMKRLEGIERKLDRNVDLKRQYNEQMSRLLKSGYAEVATTTPRAGCTWYLPHFAVVNPSKPKPRIVLDAAARTHGICLNDVLLTGPDLLQSLPGVLMRFRQRCVAVTSDIRDMFLRISVREEDRDALRFLWREDRRKGPPTEYRMRSVIFGAASSPCTAIYIKNRNAEEHRHLYPEAADAINHNHYMDDYLQSFDSPQQAIRVASNVDYVHRQAQFQLQKWASNRPEVLEAIAPTQENRGYEVNLQASPTEKTLGLVWRPTQDLLAFNLDLKRVQPEIADGTKRPTKREALRTIMSLFDPLGLVTPVIMPAKRLLQDAWRLGVGWDDELPDELHQAWLEWLGHVQQLRHLTIARCYPHYATAVRLEMHIFVDASETACVATVYWRAVTQCATAHLSLAMAKGKVAPLKTTSIPRLELQAAVLGCRLARTVEAEHDLKPARRVFWTDSRTVLAWLRAGPRSYKPFVAHRVAEIEQETKVSEWRWVPTALNVADDATRGTPSGLCREHRWFRGPDFLYQPEESWPREPELPQPPTTGEERVALTTRDSPHLIDALPDITRFSSWLRLVRATGRVLLFIELCRARRATITASTNKRTRRNDGDDMWKQTTSRRPTAPSRARPPSLTTASSYVPLESHHLQSAEKLWWRATQAESFGDDLNLLRKEFSLRQDSQLRALSVTLDKEGVMRLKSRIDSAPQLPEERRSPPILDGGNAYTRLYITWVHKQNHHAGTETVVNEVRARLWVLRLRPTARSIVKRCIKCRRLRAKPASPSTGDHPSTRLAHHQRPFTFVGLDYFGPCSVTVGRRHEKRYVALFTCLTTRAVHLEVAGSLSTDSAIMALRRMMARRGCPTEIHSDNGTNMRGADAELRRAAQQATKNEATSHTIRWRYIPPGSPFMGGAWERLVQSVKRALAATLNERHPTEEVFTTLLLEAEYTVNNRPLTPVSTSADDPESLTPLHFILGGPARVPQPGSFTERDFNLKARWRHSQRLADIFWARWIREYVPLLQHRREPRSRGWVPKEGDIVLLVDENLPRNSWPLGQITALFPGKDGVLRVVEVRTKAGKLKRAVKKVVVLTNEMHEVHGGRM